LRRITHTLLTIAIGTLAIGGFCTTRADNLRSDQWQPLLYEPQNKARQALSSIVVTRPNPGDIHEGMPDQDFGPRDFDDAADFGGMSYITNHHSQLGPNAIVIRLASEASQYWSQEPPQSIPDGSVSSVTSISYTFRLMKDAYVRLASHSETGTENGGSSAASFRLSGPFGQILAFDGTRAVSEVFATLVAGNYTLTASATSHNGGTPFPSLIKHAFAQVNFEMRQWPDRSPVEILDLYRSQWLTADDAARRVSVLNTPMSRFWAGGVIPLGVAADGVTPLLVRWRPDTMSEYATMSASSGTLVTIEHFNEGPPFVSDSVFEQVEIEGVNGRVDLPGYQHANRYACAVYIPTGEYAQGGFGDFGHDPIRMERVLAESFLRGVPVQQEPLDLPLYRPAVVLLHGVEDEAASWKWDLIHDARFDVYVAQYRATHSAAVLTNVYQNRVVLRSVALARIKLWEQGIANTQVDIFAHSMGGLLAREWSESANVYLRLDNGYRGDFHKLITVCTPHRGSELSFLAVNPDNTRTPMGSIWGRVMDTIYGRDTLGGAARDMRPDSDFLFSLNSRGPAVPIPTHALYGDGGSDVDPWAYYVWRTNFLLGQCSPPLNMSVFFGGDSDAVVSVNSQLHGLTGLRTYSLHGASGLHFPVINGPTEDTPNEPANDRAVFLLNANTDSEVFAPSFPLFPSRISPSAATVACANQTQGMPDLTFATPVAGSVFAPNELVVVEIATPLPVTAIRVFALGDAIVFESADPHRFVVRLPNKIGTVQILAHATLQEPFTGRISAKTFVRVSPSSPPSVMRTSQTQISLDRFAPVTDVLVEGLFDDNGWLDITSEAGTIYQVSDMSVATVTEDGHIVARRVGHTTVSMRNGPTQLQVPVDVLQAPGDWNSDGLIDGIDISAFARAFTGPRESASFQPPAASNQFVFDLDGDNDIDCDDWRSLLALWSGPLPLPEFSSCPSCRADFNGFGGVTIQDLFDFLGAWFAGAPAADINGQGGVSLQDIFDYLGAWFAGCP